MRTIQRLFALLIVGAIACGGDSTTAPEGISFGSYTLQSVNGQKLPYVILQSGTGSITLTEDHITISDGGSWAEIAVYRVTSNGTTTTQNDASAGSWLRSGNSLALYDGPTGQVSYTGNFSTNIITLSNSIGVQVFTK